MGREVFDYAFKEYANRWAFKHPSPADFFRTMEDASGVDLDWFWRGWFYTNDHVDISLSDVKYFKADSKNPVIENAKIKENLPLPDISVIRNEKDIPSTQEEIDPTIVDFYSTYDPLAVDAIDEEEYDNYVNSLTEQERILLEEDKHYYELTFENKGGLVMPLIMQFNYVDGSDEIIRIPAEIWKLENQEVSKIFPTSLEIKSIVFDPYQELADTDTSNNHYPPKQEASRFEIYKSQRRSRGATGRENQMQRAKRAAAKKKVIRP